MSQNAINANPNSNGLVVPEHCLQTARLLHTVGTAVPGKKAKGAPAEKANGAPAEKAKGAPAKKAKGAPVKKAKRKPKGKGKCLCKECQHCYSTTTKNHSFNVKCGSKCPLCDAYHTKYGTKPTFQHKGKTIPGCCTCKAINEDDGGFTLCTTCRSETCARRSNFAGKQDPLAIGEVRLMFRNPKGGVGLSRGRFLKVVSVKDALESFNGLTRADVQPYVAPYIH